MEIEFLKSKINERFPNVESFAQAIGLSKQAVYLWLNGRSKPEHSHLLNVASILGLSEADFDRLLGVPTTDIFFRKKGLSAANSATVSRSRELADTFFKIAGTSYIVKDEVLFGTPSQSITAVCSYIRGLVARQNDEPVRFSDLFNELSRHNINIFFMPFERIGIHLGNNLQARREVAFTARKGSRLIIFVDTNRKLDEAAFDICHELAHIILGHDDPDEEDERLCNEIASELLYPDAYLKLHRDQLNVFLDAKRSSWFQAKEQFSALSREFDWSPKGLALALKAANAITEGGHEFNRLMKMNVDFSKNKRDLDSLYFSKFVTTDYDALLQFFNSEVQRNRELYKPFLELRDAAVFGRLSARKLSELLHLDSGDADELARTWASEEAVSGGDEIGHVTP